jgi:hypothetical protein
VDENRFFRFLWRINAILMLCALLLVIGKSISEELDRRSRQPYEAPYNYATHEVDEKGGTVVEERWRYGGPSEVIGTSSLVLSLVSSGDADGPSYQLRNLLFVDANLENSAWLLPDNEKHILSHELLRFGDRDRVLAILYEIKAADSAESVQGGDQSSIYLSRPDGKELTPVVVGLDRSIGHAMTDERHLVVFYVKDGAAHSKKIALSDFSVVESIALPPIE